MSGFSSEESELIERLIRVGVDKHEAKVLVALTDEDTTTSRDIEDKTILRQPEVSLSLKDLREKEWVSKTGEKKIGSGKGRPVNLYSLAVDFSEIIEELEEQMEKKIQLEKKNIQSLKELSEEVF